MNDQQLRKIESIFCEYALHKDNIHLGFGLGGNVLYYGFVQNKLLIISNDVNEIDIVDNKIYWNPDFLSKSKKEIRKHLDALITLKIEQDGFNFSLDINWNDVDNLVKNANIDEILSGKENVPLDLNAISKLAMYRRICAGFIKQMDEGNADNCKRFSDIMSNVRTDTALLAIRVEIGTDRVLKYDLDRDDMLLPMLITINKALFAE